ncbi:MAG: helix-turn-helix domain-containing protein [Saccharopolyspora sp.]|uniref:IclR family transcriptional regulator domain-containing protein n=1 Tax=Saccharopolyspora sp. TaxID=33915 RepID=UPI0025CDE8EE|nr:IclR family transcriptional regulator C-terminal domain-containing protein [Saccharopolyspora sp.]MBQ6644289.1 helix-turn-helix domain-containing protein [Saccharopolyspora sp.]
MNQESSSSVHRAAAILGVLGSVDAAERGSLGVVEIARRVRREKTQISRALRVLEETGMVARDPETLGYRLGWRMFTMAAHVGQQRLLAEAPPVLRSVVSVTKERAHLTVLDGDGALTVMSESPMRAVQTAGWVGRVTPLHTTSSGRALLFDHDDDEIRDLLDDAVFDRAGPRAPQDAEDVISRVREARARGYALVHEEFEECLVAAAAPVRDFRNRVIAALNVSAPKFRVRAVASVNAIADGARSTRAMHDERTWNSLLERVMADRARRTELGRSEITSPWDIVRLDLDDNTDGYVGTELYRAPGFGSGVTLESADMLLRFSPEAVAHRIAPRPLLVVHGSTNELHKPEEARSLYAHAAEPKRLELIDDAGHTEFMFDEHPTFCGLVDRLDDFFDDAPDRAPVG